MIATTNPASIGEYRFEGRGIAKMGRSEHNSFVVDFRYDEGGSFFTGIPISPQSYRKKHPTKARVQMRDDGGIDLWDDWGHCVIVTGDEEFIATLFKECEEQGLVSPDPAPEIDRLQRLTPQNEQP